MTILDDGLEAQKQNKFKDWYLSLSQSEKEEFDNEIKMAVGRIEQAFQEITKYFTDTLPFVFAIFAPLLSEFSERLKR